MLVIDKGVKDNGPNVRCEERFIEICCETLRLPVLHQSNGTADVLRPGCVFREVEQLQSQLTCLEVMLSRKKGL